MKKELVISVSGEQISIAILEDNNLVEFHKDSSKHTYAVGNIYLGRVKKLLPGLNAAFIDIGYEKGAFILYHDLGGHFLTFYRPLPFILEIVIPKMMNFLYC